MKSSASKLVSKKHSPAPKRTTGYILFCLENRRLLKSTLEGASVIDMNILLGNLWAELSDEKRQVTFILFFQCIFQCVLNIILKNFHYSFIGFLREGRQN